MNNFILVCHVQPQYNVKVCSLSSRKCEKVLQENKLFLFKFFTYCFKNCIAKFKIWQEVYHGIKYK